MWPELIITALQVIGGVFTIVVIWKIIIPWIRVTSKWADFEEKKLDIKLAEVEEEKKE